MSAIITRVAWTLGWVCACAFWGCNALPEPSSERATAASVPSVSHQESAAIDAYIHNLKTIRWYIPETTGFGNQNATLNAIRWVNSRGFPGNHQVVYQSILKNGNQSTLASLVPGFSASLLFQSVPNMRATFLSVEDVFTHDFQATELGVTGAYDVASGELKEALKTHYFLHLMPVGWFQEKMALRSVSEVRPLEQLHNIPTRLDVQEVNDWSAFLQGVIRYHPSFLRKEDFFKVLFETEIDILLVQRADNARHFFAIDSVVNDIVSQHPQHFPHGVLVLVLYDRSHDVTLDVEGKLSGFYKFADVEKVDVDAFRSKANAAVHHGYLHTGDLPPTVYAQLFKKTRLPILIEGANSIELARNLGKVYFKLVAKTTLQSPYVPSAPNVQQLLDDAYTAVERYPGALTALKTLFLAALDTDAEVSQHFKALFPPDAPDKMLLSFRELVNMKIASRACQP